MKKMVFALVAFMAALQLMAIPARPGKLTYVQPDGTTVTLFRHGDEFGHWTTDDRGRLVRQDADGFYREVTDSDVPALRRQAAVRRMQARALSRAKASQHIALGQKRFLVILVEFKDMKFTKAGDDPQATFTQMLNEAGYRENGGVGSARDFYYDNSHGLFEPVFDVYGPVTLDRNYSYYGENGSQGEDLHPEQAVIDGCKGLDEAIDFSQYDHDGDGYVDLVFMYYAGHGEADYSDSDTIWPHQFELSSAGKSLTLDGKKIDSYACTNEVEGTGLYANKLCGIGTACHEFGHAMGLPDFYDTDYDEYGQAAGLFGFSTMDMGAYNENGRRPCYFTIEERIMLGWLKEEEAFRTFDKTGTYTLTTVDDQVAYRTFTDMDGEYFVYECRASNGWDAGLGAHGLLVYHVDKSERSIRVFGTYDVTPYELWANWGQFNAINENGSHPCYYVVPAADQGNLMFGYEYDAGYGYYFNEDKYPLIPFPGSDKVTTYVPRSWNGVEGDITFSNIAYAGDQVTLKAHVPSEDLDYLTIADAGSYRAGERFTFSLVRPEAVDMPAAVVWYFDDEPVLADSVTLTAGAHTVEAVLTHADGQTQMLTLEIDVE